MDLSLRRLIKKYRICIYAFVISLPIFWLIYGGGINGLIWGAFTSAMLGSVFFVVRFSCWMLGIDQKKRKPRTR